MDKQCYFLLVLRDEPVEYPRWLPLNGWDVLARLEDLTAKEALAVQQAVEQLDECFQYDTSLSVESESEASKTPGRYLVLCRDAKRTEDKLHGKTQEEIEHYSFFRWAVAALEFAEEIRRQRGNRSDTESRDEKNDGLDGEIEPKWLLCLDVGHGPLVFDCVDNLTWGEAKTLIDLLTGPIEKAGGDFTIVLDDDRTENPALYIQTRIAWEEYVHVLAEAEPYEPPVPTQFWQEPPPAILGNIVGPDMRLWAHHLCRQFIDELMGLRRDPTIETDRVNETQPQQPTNDGLFIPGPLQREILKALNGKALKKQALADLVCKGEGTVLYRPGGIKELRKHSLVDHKSRIGYYRPDAPPPGTIKPD